MTARRRIALVVIVKNEAHAIFEWLAHHAAIGVDHFIVYDNRSTDATRDEIRAFPDPRRVTLIDWPMTFGQMPAYRDAHRRFGRRFGWMGFIDADEFLIPLQSESLPAILADFENEDGLAVPWTLFGSAGHGPRPHGLVMENYTRRAPLDFGVNRHIKCLMRTDRLADFTSSPHIFVSARNRIVREDGLSMDGKSLLPEPIVPRRLRLHHYVVQSREDYAAKQARGVCHPSQPRAETFFAYHDRNEEEDLTALPFAAAVRATMARRRPPRPARFARFLWAFRR